MEVFAKRYNFSTGEVRNFKRIIPDELPQTPFTELLSKQESSSSKRKDRSRNNAQAASFPSRLPFGQ